MQHYNCDRGEIVFKIGNVINKLVVYINYKSYIIHLVTINNLII